MRSRAAHTFLDSLLLFLHRLTLRQRRAQQLHQLIHLPCKPSSLARPAATTRTSQNERECPGTNEHSLMATPKDKKESLEKMPKPPQPQEGRPTNPCETPRRSPATIGSAPARCWWPWCSSSRFRAARQTRTKVLASGRPSSHAPSRCTLL